MSAPSAIRSRAVAHGVLAPGKVQKRPPSQKTKTKSLRTGIPEQRDRRSTDSIAILSREHDHVCREAVDSGDIAASLEAAGLNDREARERYGVGSVFELAQALHDMVPKRLPEWERPRDPWRYPVGRHLRRGVLYALPTLPYLAALHVLHGSVSGIMTLLVGSILAMAATHGLSYAGHLMVGYGSYRSAARILVRGLLAAILAGGTVTGLLIWQGGLHRGPLVVAYVELVYVVAATSLMTFEREKLLFVSLFPAVTASVIALARPDMPRSWLMVVFGLIVTCAALTTAMAYFTVRCYIGIRKGVRTRLVPQEVRRALAHALYGSVTAGLLMYAVLDALVYENTSLKSNTLIGIGMLPLVTSLGITEWNLHGFRSDTERILQNTSDFQRFAAEVLQSLARRVLAYGAVLVVLTAAILVPLGPAGSLTTVLGARHVAYDILGIALFLTTVLVSCGLVERTLLLLCTALLADSALRLAIPDALVDVTRLHCVVFASLAVALAVIARRELSSPLRFR